MTGYRAITVKNGKRARARVQPSGTKRDQEVKGQRRDETEKLLRREGRRKRNRDAIVAGSKGLDGVTNRRRRQRRQ